jgi:hypothetical protein
MGPLSRSFVLCLLPSALACASGAELVLECPGGTRQRQEGVESWCETPDGLSHGPTWTSYGDGSVASLGTTVQGRLEGPFRKWHPNGRLASEAEFHQDGLVGPFRSWDPQGRLEVEGQHDDAGRMHGTWGASGRGAARVAGSSTVRTDS